VAGVLDELLSRLQNGDENAGAFLVSLVAPSLHGYARATAGDLSDTDRERICELALERAVRKIDRFDPTKGSFLRWLRTFVRHEAGNWRRSNHALDELDEDAVASEVEPEQPAEWRAAVAAVERAVHELSHTDQLIIALRDREGLSYADIASRVGANEDACRQRHLRALRRLKRIAESDPELQRFKEGGVSDEQ
jgi:RNA polymerase sigma-70 factor (ECF subfamily)